MQDESANLAAEFPYRINLFKQGQVDKNSAGVRIAETANQLLSNNSGLLFYYEVVTDAMRVPHWHANATEIGTVLSGKMRVTIWEGAGNTKIYTVEKNGTWIIPKAKLHSLENVGQEKMKFLVVYDSPIAADRDFLTAWASLPDAILARAVGLSESDIASIKKTTVNRLSAFDPAASPEKGDMYSDLSNNFMTTKPLYQSELGSITRVDSKVNPHIDGMALQRTIMKPNVLRVPHWYTSGDVLLFVLRGDAFFTMMDNDGKVYHSLIHRGDLISIPVGNFHSFLNIGNEDLEIYEGFNRTDGINEITLMNGVQHFNLGTMAGATGLSKDLIKKIQQEKLESYMVKF
nr:cupin domain-containing protein [Legionella micdadei]